MNLARDERDALCDLLLHVGPGAPTLCEGWDAHALASHLWVRESDPVGAVGIMAAPLAGLTDRHMAEVRRRWPYQDLVERVRRGPSRWSPFALPGVENLANGLEFFVHHEDVRRAGPDPADPRDLGAEVDDWLWRRMRQMSRLLHRTATVGVVLERSRPGSAAVPDPADRVRIRPGDRTVTIIGAPAELILYGFGRTSAAQVHFLGEPAAVAELRRTKDES